MPRPNLKHITVYVTEEQHSEILEAAARTNRSASNYLLTLWIAYGEKFGTQERTDTKSPTKQRVSKKRA
jgi:hypothetical protein